MKSLDVKIHDVERRLSTGQRSTLPRAASDDYREG
jgi:hypothetical protein